MSTLKVFFTVAGLAFATLTLSACGDTFEGAVEDTEDNIDATEDAVDDAVN